MLTFLIGCLIGGVIGAILGCLWLINWACGSLAWPCPCPDDEEDPK